MPAMTVFDHSFRARAHERGGVPARMRGHALDRQVAGQRIKAHTFFRIANHDSATTALHGFHEAFIKPLEAL